jgi:hypothetical protein
MASEGKNPLSFGQILGLGAAGVGALQAGISAIGMGKTKRQAFKAIEDIPTYTEDPETKAALAMRKARLGTGLSAEAKNIAKQGIGTAAASATKGALSMGKGAGLATLGAIQRQSARQSQQLGLQEEQAQERGRMAYERAVGEAAVERRRAFASEQEKKQLAANIRLEQLAAKKAAVQQGIKGITSGLTSAITAGLFGGEEGGGDGSSYMNPRQAARYASNLGKSREQFASLMAANPIPKRGR